MTPKRNRFTALHLPMTPRRNTVFTALMAAMMIFLLVFACIQSHWWPLLVVTGAYLFTTIWTIRLQLKNPASAQLMRMVFAVPSALMGVLAVLFSVVMKSGPNALLLK